MPTIHDLPALLADVPIANTILNVEQTTGELTIPDSMEPWVAAHFGSLDAVREQTITCVTNRYTLESALFNPLRAKRPSNATSSDTELEAWIATELRNDIFADPLRDTTADLFGRITGQYCVSAANIAKYAKWHGLVIPHQPHPLHFDQAHIRDYLDVALRWIATVQAHDAHARYPLITWNCLPKSGATIVHSHWQIAVATTQPYTRSELWRRAIRAYHTQTNRDYVNDLCAIHQHCDLVFSSLGLPFMAHLTPLRSREVLGIAPPAARIAGTREAITLADTLCQILRILIDRLGMRTFNLAIALPPPDPTGWEGFPVLVRIGDRGAALTTRGDLGAMELYGTGVIATDPFELARTMRYYWDAYEDTEVGM